MSLGARKKIPPTETQLLVAIERSDDERDLGAPGPKRLRLIEQNAKHAHGDKFVPFVHSCLVALNPNDSLAQHSGSFCRSCDFELKDEVCASFASTRQSFANTEEQKKLTLDAATCRASFP